MLLTGKIWEFLAYITLPILYVLIKRHIYRAVRIWFTLLSQYVLSLATSGSESLHLRRMK